MPNFLKKTEANACTIADITDADLILIDIVPVKLSTATCYSRLVDNCIISSNIFFSKLGVSAKYISPKLDISKLSNRDLRYISKIQYGHNLFAFGQMSDFDVLADVFMTDHQHEVKSAGSSSNIQDILDGRKELSHAKVSAKHLRHITINELNEVDREMILRRAGFLERFVSGLMKHPDFTEAFFCGLVVWLLNLPDDLFQLVRKSKVWYQPYNTVLDFASYTKNNITLKLKALQNSLAIDLTPCFEFEVLVNRGLGSVDWQAEKDHRTDPNVCSISADTIYYRCGQLFTKLLQAGHKPTRRAWHSFWATRWKWAPAGTFFSQYSEDDEFKSADSTLRNKIYSLSAMPHYDFEHFFDRTPQIHAKAMTKYEWGKQRAIYGVDNTCFIMSNYGFGDCERLLSNMFPIGPAATEENVRMSVKHVLANGTPFCFDFEDFNSQHSTVNMQMVLSAYRDVFINHITDEQVKAINWQIAALEDVTVHWGDKQKYKALGTLLSGWRMTTFINTVLNKVYIDECIKDIPMTTLHNGDDVLASVTSLRDVQVLMKNAQECNIRFQRHKCFLGGVAEFLRVDHKQGGSGQYLPRAVSTFVHGPTESIMPNDLVSVVKSQATRAKEILERKGCRPVIERLKRGQRKWLAHIWKVEPDVIEIIERTHVSLGGINESITQNSLDYKIIRKPTRTSFDPGGKLAVDMGRHFPGADEYARFLGKQEELAPYVSSIARKVRDSIFATTIANKFTVTVERITEHRKGSLIIDANQYGMFRGQADNVKTLLAKAFKIPLYEFTKGMSIIVESLRYTTNPLETLILWT